MIRTLFSIIFFAAAIWIYFGFTQQRYEGVLALQSQNKKVAEAVTQAKEYRAMKTDLVEKYNSIDNNDANRLLKLLPDHVDNVALILDLDSLASRYGFALQNVDVSVPTEATQVIGERTSEGTYDSVTIKFGTQGTYESFLQFLSQLESSLRIVELDTLSISGSNTQNASQPVYSFNVGLKTYWLK